MSEGPSKREIDRVREALDRHDSELREDGDAPADEPDEVSEGEDDEA
jgi:hypothetical protein